MLKHSFMALFGASILAATTVFGHAKLQRTMPAADARVAQAPASLMLEFNEKVRLAQLVLTTAGRDVPVSVDREAAAAATINVKLPVLAPGRYEVHWSALTPSDGHIVKGSFSFAVDE